MTNIVTMDSVIFPPHSFSVGHGFLEHVDAECLGHLNFQYDVFL